jgi:hypothetical protein
MVKVRINVRTDVGQQWFDTPASELPANELTAGAMITLSDGGKAEIVEIDQPDEDARSQGIEKLVNVLRRW